MTKKQLVAEVMRILDDSPREIIEKMSKAELERYVENLYQTYPEERPNAETASKS